MLSPPAEKLMGKKKALPELCKVHLKWEGDYRQVEGAVGMAFILCNPKLLGNLHWSSSSVLFPRGLIQNLVNWLVVFPLTDPSRKAVQSGVTLPFILLPHVHSVTPLSGIGESRIEVNVTPSNINFSGIYQWKMEWVQGKFAPSIVCSPSVEWTPPLILFGNNLWLAADEILWTLWE